MDVFIYHHFILGTVTKYNKKNVFESKSEIVVDCGVYGAVLLQTRYYFETCSIFKHNHHLIHIYVHNTYTANIQCPLHCSL